MLFKSLEIEGAFLISSPVNSDNRGHFTRLFCQEEFNKNNLNSELVQASLSFNKKRGTLRGMHFQKSPYEEEKMVRCVRGTVYDVIVDLRPKSVTFLKWIGVELSEKNSEMIYIPKGVAHGFQSLEDDSILIYFMTEKFYPDSASGFFYDDPNIKIKWPIKEKIISEKDKNFPKFCL
jgi:dTDP-4-dehydrorhamnose 3,5-epimerase